MTLFAALGVEAISTFLGRILPAQKGAVLVMGLALASTPLIASIRMDSAFLATDTRTLAKQWFEGKVPDGATVLTEGHTAKSFNTSVQLANSRENLEHAIAHFKAMGDNGKARYFEYELEVTRARRYDLIFYNWDNLDRWESYKSLQVEYVVIRPADLLGNEKYEGFGEKFLESLRSDPDYWLAAQFDSKAGEFRGPTIEIYMRRLPGLS
ncbi:MAG: hypothetical protein IPJ33_04245 [Gammaproteobacteria bacterium]|nr:hypothetical protein [Gammaproteobacteria bacterium]